MGFYLSQWVWCPLWAGDLHQVRAWIVWDGIFHLLRWLGNVWLLFYPGGSLHCFSGAKPTSHYWGEFHLVTVCHLLFKFVNQAQFVMGFCLGTHILYLSLGHLWCFLWFLYNVIIKNQQGGAPSLFSGSLWSTGIILLLVAFGRIYQWSCMGLHFSLW